MAKPAGKPITVCVIPDIHISPEIPVTRMLWIGRWVAEQVPDHVLQLGDWLTLDSLSTHAKPDSLSRRKLPSFKEDLECGRASVAEFMRGIGHNGPGSHVPAKITMTMGNHEFRANRFEDVNPELEGTIVAGVGQIFEEAGIRIVPYGEFFFLGGVGFVHHANNTLGRPYGGKTSAQRIASDSVFSVVHGHSHQKQCADVPKIGPNHAVRAIAAGCALPNGYIEEYAAHSTTGWWWGVLKLRIVDGMILDEDWISMYTLEERYGD